MGTIAVGVDASGGSLAALEWAASEARLRGDDLRVVTAWLVPTMAFGAPGFGPIVAEGLDAEFEGAARAALEKAIEGLGAAGEGIHIERVVAHGQASHVLIEAAKDAALLVVGSRGHGGFAGLLLGSVSQQCAHHAPCPVVIVPHGSARSGGQGD